MALCPPGAAGRGLMLLIDGGPTIVKFITLLEPAPVTTCTVAAPRVAVDGMLMHTRVSLTQAPTVAGAPFSKTELPPCVAPKPCPSIHSNAPAPTGSLS